MSATPIPANTYNFPATHRPPVKTPERETIGSIVDEMAVTFCQRISALKVALELIEQEYLESVARAKGRLNDHVGFCGRLSEEVDHVQRVVTDLGERLHQV